MSLGDWIQRKMAILSIALSNVEKNALSGAGGESLGSDIATTRRVGQGTIKDDLLRGELSQNVQDLRWRMYKVLEASDGKKALITGYDGDGLPIYTMLDVSGDLKKVRRDDYDPYDVIMVVKNDDIAVGAAGTATGAVKGVDGPKQAAEIDISIMELEIPETKVVEKWEGSGDTRDDDDFEVLERKTIALVGKEELESTVKVEKPIMVHRSEHTTTPFEKYVTKMHVRKVSETEHLLEFYVSLYPDEYDRKTVFLIAEIKRAIQNPRASSMLDIEKVMFVTNKAIGAKDNLFFEYKIEKFDKIIKFNGSYVIKFLATPEIFGESITAKYVREELELKYENKEAKEGN